MSFKREGNDINLLHTLRKRRINELLSEEIPEDEAKLLCNGRFTCTVCPSNPVFDTVNVLSVHRRGKKHLSCLEVHVAKKRELKQLIAERKHQQYLKDGTTSIQMAVSVEKGIITSCPYDPRVKKTKIRKGDRRPVLEFGTNHGTTSKQQSPHQKPPTERVMTSRPPSSTLVGSRPPTSTAVGSRPPTSTAVGSRPPTSTAVGRRPPTSTAVTSVNGRSSVFKKTHEQSLLGPIMHDHQLKNIFSEKIEEPVRITPYQSKFRKYTAPVQQNSYQTSLTKELPCINVPQNNAMTNRLNTDDPTRSDTRTVSFSVQNSSSWNSETVYSVIKSSTVEHISSCGSNPFLQAGVQSQGLSAATLFLPPPPPPPPPAISTNKCSQTSSVPSVVVPSDKSLQHEDSRSFQKQGCVSEKLRILQGSGWKRDWDGKWIKDDNAEFDSDEEAPDIP